MKVRGTKAGIAAAAFGLVLVGSVGLVWAADAPKPVVPAASKPDPKALEFFESKVRPLLIANCVACHTGEKAQGALRMDTPQFFFKGGPLGPLVVPGDPDKSLLIKAVHYTDEHLKMPPKGKLKPQQIQDLTTWVKAGAPWTGYVAGAPPPKAGAASPHAWENVWASGQSHWAYKPVKIPAIPAVKNKAWVKSPIDAFILAALEKKGLKPAPAADKRTLIRRVTFDLTGLPPTPTEIDAFLADKSPDAFAKLVDRLLASPAYGERWARHWLDVVRYADSNGLDENTAFANAFRYRDYVVRALNADKPYDQFLREQIAGDLLPASPDAAESADRITATGFLCLGPKVLAEPDKDKMVMDIIDEQIDTLGRSVMGLTLGCARCHDHKFDPLPTKDYYALAGIFKSTRTMETLSTVAKVYQRPIPDPAAATARAEYQKKVDAAESAYRTASTAAESAAIERTVQNLGKYLALGLRVEVSASRAATPDVSTPGALVREAEKFERGDVQVTRGGFGEGIGIIESAGRSSAFTEYEFETAAGEYEVALRYASAEHRPVRISIDGTLLAADAAAKSTGGFFPPQQVWQRVAPVALTAGKHVLRLQQTSGSLPHVDKIALIPALKLILKSGDRPRAAQASDIAISNGLNAEVLQRSAGAVALAGQRVAGSPAALLIALGNLPDVGFAAKAVALLESWRVDGRLKALPAPLAAAFQTPPATLQEACDRFAEVLGKAAMRWREIHVSGKKLEANPDQKALLDLLVGPNSAFQLDRAERLLSNDTRASLQKQAADLEAMKKAAPPASAMVLGVADVEKPTNVRIHLRGNTLTLGDEAPRQFLTILEGGKQQPITQGSGRLQLAQWLTRPEHPLTARVMVNRIWQHHFGEGIVRSPDNFGKLGEKPTHPELLDWLASKFSGEAGWSIKKMHRVMLLSSAYQMSTAYDAKFALADPENRLLWRANRRRLEIEAIRDSMLFVSGQLDSTMGGSLLKTKDYDYVTNDQSGNAAQYDAPRRSLYLPVIRNAVFDVFQVFDFVEPSFLNGKRSTTTVAPQALFLLNGPFVLAQAKAYAERLFALPVDDAARLRQATLDVYGRPATGDEILSAQQYLQAYEQHLVAKEPDAAKRRAKAWQSFCQVLFASSEFVYLN